jgi:hypothetical protein
MQSEYCLTNDTATLLAPAPILSAKKPATVSINHYLRRPVIYADENIDGSEKT